MKLLMLLGGMAGFLIGLAFGLAQQVAWPLTLWRASAAALLAGLLLRWWGRLWVQGLHQAHHERLVASAAAAATPSTAPTKGKP